MLEPRTVVAALLASCSLLACTSGGATTGSSSATGGKGGSGVCAAPPGIGNDDAGLPSDPCATDADCSGASCVALTPGGPRACSHPSPPIPPQGAIMCQSADAGIMASCTSTSDCACGTHCYAAEVINCWAHTTASTGVTATCEADACASDADCATQPGFTAGKVICAPVGVFGRPIRTCVAAYCHTDADCTAKPGGTCAVISDPCNCFTLTGSRVGLACVYPGGCRRRSDCGYRCLPDVGPNAIYDNCEIDPTVGAGVCTKGWPTGCPD